MKRLLALSVWLAASASVGGEPVEWTDSTGKYHVKAEFVSVDNGVVVLRKANGVCVTISFDRLNADGRAACDMASKPAKGNPFTERAADPVERTAAMLIAMRERMNRQIDAAMNEDTTEKKRAAHERMTAQFSAELTGVPVAFRCPVKDVAEDPDESGARFTLDIPIGLSGFDNVLSGIKLPLRKEDAARINKGDIVVFTGKCSVGMLGISEPLAVSLNGQQAGFEFCSFQSQKTGKRYLICIDGFKFRIEHGADPHGGLKMSPGK